MYTMLVEEVKSVLNLQLAVELYPASWLLLNTDKPKFSKNISRTFDTRT